jgi:phosphopantetheinyl transferase (holo-ACP synthase)
MKAMGIAGQRGLSWRDFEVVCASSGQPAMVLHGQAAVSSDSLQLGPLHISLSHSQTAAGAIAVAETAEPRGAATKRTVTTRRSGARPK